MQCLQANYRAIAQSLAPLKDSLDATLLAQAAAIRRIRDEVLSGSLNQSARLDLISNLTAETLLAQDRAGKVLSSLGLVTSASLLVMQATLQTL